MNGHNVFMLFVKKYLLQDLTRVADVVSSLKTHDEWRQQTAIKRTKSVTAFSHIVCLS
jgi:hypothetical protein